MSKGAFVEVNSQVEVMQHDSKDTESSQDVDARNAFSRFFHAGNC